MKVCLTGRLRQLDPADLGPAYFDIFSIHLTGLRFARPSQPSPHSCRISSDEVRSKRTTQRTKEHTSILFSTKSAPATGAFTGGNTSEIEFKASNTTWNAFQPRPLRTLAVVGGCFTLWGFTAAYTSAGAEPGPAAAVGVFLVLRFGP
jgi:hypothetical protein